ncbi:LysE family translocator [Photobacterium sp. WH77]|uniref:LysE family translocator n=1 Tax=Photobacterium TaxID=657 RepID=UPI001C44A057|nr:MULTISPECIES: LysE family translocator [Photobacterium]MBV7264014.1 LysE family translocator [Photobacterium sp. WH24]MCG2838185.1 LysE family translocator [Photobacterium sp. WH77]MCG2845802.1 LysE family translocator [Photobacterium sp. WH80]MDO6583795.1 LysE family translocator [Photobacterium sp. 2_MG-2023]
MDFTLLSAFIPTFFFVSITPGMCMTLAMTLGMSIGVKRALWMMVGELLGVALVAIAAVMGVATVMLNYPQLFSALKWVGGAYLFWLGINMWRNRGKMSLNLETPTVTQRGQLISQGFITAIANPKGWAFMISLLPPFINIDMPMAPQMAGLLAVILMTEFVALLVYANGGKSLRLFLTKGDNLRYLNRIAGTLMMGVGVWLALG